MAQDMSQVPMNYRPSLKYTGRIRDLLDSPGYSAMQDDLTRIERAKLQRQYNVETSPEAHLLFSLRERDRLQRLGEQEARQREAERQQRLLAEMQRSQALNDWNIQRTAEAAPQMWKFNTFGHEIRTTDPKKAAILRRTPGYTESSGGPSGGLDVLSPFAGSGDQIGLGHGSGGMFGRSTDPDRRF